MKLEVGVKYFYKLQLNIFMLSDDSQTSDSSGSEFFNNYSCNIRRSATLYTSGHTMTNTMPSKTGTLNTRLNNSRHLPPAQIHSRGNYSSATQGRLPRTTLDARPRDYGVRSHGSSATLGRTPRNWCPAAGSSRGRYANSRNNSQDDIIGHVSESDLYHSHRHGRKVKRTESFV